MSRAVSRVCWMAPLVVMLCCVNPMGMLGCNNPPAMVPEPPPEQVYEDVLAFFEEEQLEHIQRFVQLDGGVLELDLRLSPSTQMVARANVDEFEAPSFDVISSAHAASADPLPDPIYRGSGFAGQLDLVWRADGGGEPVMLLQQAPVSATLLMEYRVKVSGSGWHSHKKSRASGASTMLVQLDDPSNVSAFHLSFYLSETNATPPEGDPSEPQPSRPMGDPEEPEEYNPLSRIPLYPLSRSMTLVHVDEQVDLFVYSDFETDGTDTSGYWRMPRPPRESELMWSMP